MKKLLVACIVLCINQSGLRAADSPDPMAGVNALRSQVTDLENIEKISSCKLRIKFYNSEQQAQKSLEKEPPSPKDALQMRKRLSKAARENRLRDRSLAASFKKGITEYRDAHVTSNEHKRQLTTLVEQSKIINPDEVSPRTLYTITQELDSVFAQYEETSETARILRRKAFTVLSKNSNNEPFLRSLILVKECDKLNNPPKMLAAGADYLYDLRFNKNVSLDDLDTRCDSFEKMLKEYTSKTT